MNPSLNDVRGNCYLLDGDDFVIPESVRLISHEQFSSFPGIVEFIPPGPLARFFTRSKIIYNLIYAHQLLRAADKNTVLIINGSLPFLWYFVALLNSWCFIRKRTLFGWDIFVEYILGTKKKVWFLPFATITTKFKECVGRYVMQQYGINVVWSKKQVESHSRHFNLPARHFVFLPYKSTHSKEGINYNIEMGRFVFAGGNGKRDYQCLINAVRGTNIPVIISATDAAVRKSLELLPNVILLGAPEPAFAKLQAACSIIVIPMINTGLKGGGETNICNAMWHKKPVIAVDEMAADDYIVEGETGFIVPVGNSAMLKERIFELWNDLDKSREMGVKGRERAEKYFTHFLGLRRLIRLAFLYGEDAIKQNNCKITL